MIYYMIFALLCVTLLWVSALLPEVGGDVVYLLAFSLPLFLGYIYSRRAKRRREEERGLAEGEFKLFSLSGEKLCLFLPLIFPTVGLVFLISFLTSLAMSSLGVSAPVPEGSFPRLLLSSVIAPSILEELVFRYLPMLIILPYSKRYTVIISAWCFAVIHNPVSMPYALIAGVLFMLFDITAGSVLPSVILHFLNNLLSLVWMFFFAGRETALIFVLLLLLGSLISFGFVYALRKKYAELFHSSWKSEGKPEEYRGM